MKRIELYVDGRRFIIEECDGRAEIRAASQPRAMASDRLTTTVVDECGGPGFPIELKVESRE